MRTNGGLACLAGILCGLEGIFPAFSLPRVKRWTRNGRKICPNSPVFLATKASRWASVCVNVASNISFISLIFPYVMFCHIPTYISLSVL